MTFCWLTIRQVDWDAVGSALGAVTGPGIAVALAFKIGSDVVRAIRWRCLWTERRVSIMRLYVAETAAVGLNNVSPVHVLDEPLLLAMLTVRDRLPAGPVLATLVMTRVQDLTFTLLFAGLALLVVPDLLDVAWPMTLMGLGLFAAIVVVFNLGWLLSRVPVLARVGLMVNFSQGVDNLKRRPRRLALGLALTAAYWCLLGPGAAVMGHSMGITLSVPEMTIVVLCSIFFGTAVPSLPGGIGPFQWSVVTLLGLYEVDHESALAFAILLHLVLFLPSSLVTVIALPREGIGTLRALRGVLRGTPAAAGAERLGVVAPEAELDTPGVGNRSGGPLH